MSNNSKMNRDSCEKYASELLKDTGATKVPIRVEKIAKECGIKVRYSPLDKDLSGAIFYKDGAPVIGVNSRHPVNRQRFTIAHELGHFIMHDEILKQGALVDNDATMLKRDHKSATGDVLIEIQANQFAAELLMPKNLVLDLLRKHGLDSDTTPDEDTVEQMARDFKVSTTAMAIRIEKIYG